MRLDPKPAEPLACLIAGAGPTGLSLAAQLRRFDVPFRLVDRSTDRAHESRALAVQARTLELFDALSIAEPLVARGKTSARLALHFGGRRVASVTLGGMGPADTRFPFVLFVSQAETERLLGEHLAGAGVPVERGVELAALDARDEHVECLLRHRDGREERVRARYVVGCDGAHSFVRRAAGFSFQGGSYPDEFVLGDVEADGPLEEGAIHSFVGDGGVAVFFPLGEPTTWRVVGMKPRRELAPRAAVADEPSPAGPLTLEELRAIVAVPTGGQVSVRDPAWLSHFRLHHRQAARYRRGRVFLAGDAAHIHSPVGGQGMNTGIQDAWNLGWKLALVLRGEARETLLDSYEAERWAVGQTLLRFTDRIFSTFTRTMSGGRLASFLRDAVVPRLIPVVYGTTWLRSRGFRFISELGIRYRRSPIVLEGHPRLRGGPRAGDRLPDALLSLDGRRVALQRAVVGANFGLLLCGEAARWSSPQLAELAAKYGPLLAIHRLTAGSEPGALVGDAGLLASFAAENGAQYLVRPDGYIAFRCAGYGLDGVAAYLGEYLTRAGAGGTPLNVS